MNYKLVAYSSMDERSIMNCNYVARANSEKKLEHEHTVIYLSIIMILTTELAIFRVALNISKQKTEIAHLLCYDITYTLWSVSSTSTKGKN